MAYHDIGSLDDLERGSAITAYIASVDVVVHKVGDQLFATDRWCPHSRGDLSTGALTGGVITCPDHGWQFDVASGVCHKKNGGRPLQTYPCRVRAGRIEVDLPAAG